MIPPDALVPPLKPADIGGTEEGGHQIHAEHVMKAPPGNSDQSLGDLRSFFY